MGSMTRLRLIRQTGNSSSYVELCISATMPTCELCVGALPHVPTRPWLGRFPTRCSQRTAHNRPHSPRVTNHVKDEHEGRQLSSTAACTRLAEAERPGSACSRILGVSRVPAVRGKHPARLPRLHRALRSLDAA